MKVNIANTKLNVYKIVLQEVCKKVSGTEEYIYKKNILRAMSWKKIIRKKGKLLVYE